MGTAAAVRRQAGLGPRLGVVEGTRGRTGRVPSRKGRRERSSVWSRAGCSGAEQEGGGAAGGAGVGREWRLGHGGGEAQDSRAEHG